MPNCDVENCQRDGRPVIDCFVDECMLRLCERHREMVDWFCGDQLTIAEIARKFHVLPEEVEQAIGVQLRALWCGDAGRVDMKELGRQRRTSIYGHWYYRELGEKRRRLNPPCNPIERGV